MGRAKPFSQAQKKKQLQEKREQKRMNKNKEWDWNEVEGSRQEKTKPTATGRSLISQFQRLTAEEIEEKKQLSRRPYLKIPKEAQRMGIQDIYPEDKIIRIPSRPTWSYSMSKEELDENERAEFDKWLQSIEETYASEKLSYFERNIEVWRQLWRTVEMSDILVVVTDARFPILHFPPSLYQYIVETVKKPLIVIMNKIDLVPNNVAQEWHDFMKQRFPHLHIIESCGFSKKQIEAVQEGGDKKLYKRPNYSNSFGVINVLECCKKIAKGLPGMVNVDWDSVIRERLGKVQQQESDLDEDDEGEDDEDEDDDSETESETVSPSHEEPTDTHPQRQSPKRPSFITVGMIGHPNVGKSTLVNALIGKKVVSVSKTPGHTKHFQTIFISKDLRLCDCPGLVFPSLIPKPLQVICGVFNVAQVQEPYSSIQYLAERIDLPGILEIQLQLDEATGELPGNWSVYEICRALAIKRGFVTSRAGRPDIYRAANFILRMTIDGRLINFYLRPK